MARYTIKTAVMKPHHLFVGCAVCGASIMAPCRGISGQKITRTHSERARAARKHLGLARNGQPMHSPLDARGKR